VSARLHKKGLEHASDHERRRETDIAGALRVKP
jgi:hypothetical protein